MPLLLSVPLRARRAARRVNADVHDLLLNARSGRRIAVLDPFTGELVGEVPMRPRAQVRRRSTAGAAYRDELDRHARSTLLFAVADRIAARRRRARPR